MSHVGTTHPARLRLACGAVLVVEAVGSLLMWAPIPLAWIWIGSRVYRLTDSLALYGFVALLGFLVTIWAMMVALDRLDRTWVSLRRRAGHPQATGALSNIVIVSATLGLAAFFVWYYLLTDAFIIPFMPSQ